MPWVPSSKARVRVGPGSPGPILLAALPNAARPQPDVSDFESGGLSVPSNIRPSRLFTADAAIVASVAGRLTFAKLIEAVEAVKAILG